LERDVMQAVAVGQQRLGHDLYDSVVQEETALNLLAEDLGEVVQTDLVQAARRVQKLTE
jgi:hypothetical protein